MHPWVIWHLAEERVEELHGHRDQPRHHLRGAGAVSPRRPSRIGLGDRLAGWAGRHLITTGTRLARRGRRAGVGTEARGAAR
jgi:hypothetical protein